jgi:hypothetical protein
LPYPFIPVTVIPSMNVFWVKKKRKRIGRMVAVLAAIR